MTDSDCLVSLRIRLGISARLFKLGPCLGVTAVGTLVAGDTGAHVPRIRTGMLLYSRC